MADHRFSRTERLLGKEGLAALRASHVMLIGLGGVGGHALDALVRVGVGHITVVDGDAVALSNCNRQMLATLATVGKRKAGVAAAHVARIAPEAKVTCLDMFVTAENAAWLLDTHPADVVLDAIDSLGAKVALARAATERGVPFLSCMSTGNRIDPSRLCISDLSKTHTCPISRIMRRELGKYDIRHLNVLWSDEPTMTPAPAEGGGNPPASLPFVPATAGIRMAQWATTIILDGKGQSQ